MAQDIYQLSRLYRSQLLQRDAQSLLRVTHAYLPVFSQLNSQLAMLTRQIEAARASGQTISKAWLYRQERYQSLLVQIAQQIQRYADGVVVPGLTAEQRALVNLAQEHAAGMITTQTGDAFAAFSRLPASAVEQFVGFAGNGTALDRVFKNYGRTVAGLVRDRLTEGVALGHGVAKVSKDVAGLLDRPRWEAARLVRTESLRSYREASRLQYQNAGAKVWIWLSSHSLRTCLACLALDGKEFPLEKPMPAHPSCRCTAIPKLQNVTLPKRQTGGQWFAAQPAAVKREKLGSAYSAFQSGEISLDDFVGVRRSKEWGEMRYQKPAQDALR